MITLKASRRDALKIGTAVALAAISSSISSPFAIGQQAIVEPKRPPSIDPKLVGQFVGTCHRNLDTVKSILKKESGVVNASFNRGGGDWESGMEAAAHMGRPDIFGNYHYESAEKKGFNQIARFLRDRAGN